IRKRDSIQSNLVAGKRNSAKPSDERRDESKDAALQRELNGSRESQSNEAADARQVDVDGSAQQFGSVLPVVPEQVTDEHRGHVKPGDGRRPAGTNRTHSGRSPFAVNENPIADC